MSLRADQSKMPCHEPGSRNGDSIAHDTYQAAVNHFTMPASADPTDSPASSRVRSRCLQCISCLGFLLQPLSSESGPPLLPNIKHLLLYPVSKQSANSKPRTYPVVQTQHVVGRHLAHASEANTALFFDKHLEVAHPSQLLCSA